MIWRLTSPRPCGRGAVGPWGHAARCAGDTWQCHRQCHVTVIDPIGTLQKCRRRPFETTSVEYILFMCSLLLHLLHQVQRYEPLLAQQHVTRVMHDFGFTMHPQHKTLINVYQERILIDDFALCSKVRGRERPVLHTCLSSSKTKSANS